VDALNTFFTFPLFVIKGPRWALSAAISTMPSKKKDEEIPLSDADRKSFQLLWELFMVCYEGYFGFTASTLICIYKVPETIPIFSYSLFVLYAYKCKVLWTTFSHTRDAQARTKLLWVLFFFLPCYGGYCVLHLLESLLLG
jgi:hypothetical protein